MTQTLLITLLLAAGAFVFRRLARPSRSRAIDAGSVSHNWIVEHRGEPH